MAISPSTFYYNAQTFSLATDVWLDPDLTNPAPDGFYATAGIYRQKSGGVLGAPQSCGTCTAPCGPSTPIADSVRGKYRMTLDLGSATGAVVIAFNNGTSSPAKCQWVYDGITASEYTNATWGYLTGLVGTINSGSTCPGGAITQVLGSNGVSYSGNDYLYESLSTSFQNTGNTITMGPYAPADVSLVPSTPSIGNCLMVVPKLNANPSTIDLTVEVPCLDDNWSLIVNCPTALQSFDRGIENGTCAFTGTPMYTASPYTTTGLDPMFHQYDWVFEDPNGLTPLAIGTYPVLQTATGVTHCVSISSDGVIVNITTCSGAC